jgi:hypothetical protein
VQKRDKETLILLIEKYVEKGSTFITDCWASYTCLKDLGYKHETVNHSENCVDPSTGACTNLRLYKCRIRNAQTSYFYLSIVILNDQLSSVFNSGEDPSTIKGMISTPSPNPKMVYFGHVAIQVKLAI